MAYTDTDNLRLLSHFSPSFDGLWRLGKNTRWHTCTALFQIRVNRFPRLPKPSTNALTSRPTYVLRTAYSASDRFVFLDATSVIPPLRWAKRNLKSGTRQALQIAIASVTDHSDVLSLKGPRRHRVESHARAARSRFEFSSSAIPVRSYSPKSKNNASNFTLYCNTILQSARKF